VTLLLYLAQVVTNITTAALAVIQLPIKPFERDEQSIVERAILKDVLYDMWMVFDEIDKRDKQEPVRYRDGEIPESKALSSVIPYRRRRQSPARNGCQPISDRIPTSAPARGNHEVMSSMRQPHKHTTSAVGGSHANGETDVTATGVPRTATITTTFVPGAEARGRPDVFGAPADLAQQVSNSLMHGDNVPMVMKRGVHNTRKSPRRSGFTSFARREPRAEDEIIPRESVSSPLLQKLQMSKPSTNAGDEDDDGFVHLSGDSADEWAII